ncbi:hypothetical protein T265_12177 [Opisthorchis viverrini]|uniref:Uncharacterized protein n=1 Tax=Opisthorchis viverrini TaxID=6198 RepID=A0A074YZU1_OPIVI|nr:hypothetical protein T265_12177 [Opisthorchis viverrini]KER18727.1 hypothetical protein T265_12177 [Opisthorchis viverrini]
MRHKRWHAVDLERCDKALVQVTTFVKLVISGSVDSCVPVRHMTAAGSGRKALKKLFLPNKMVHALNPIFPSAMSQLSSTQRGSSLRGYMCIETASGSETRNATSLSVD